MKPWLVRPRDPLIVRDGRPFGPDPGARASSLSFPFPSTVAGAVRTRNGLAKGGFDDAGKMAAQVRNETVRGPLLALVDTEAPDEITSESLLFPAPLDALLLNLEPPEDDRAQRLWLRPLKLDSDAQSNLPADLFHVGAAKPKMVKPLSGAPKFWWWRELITWLENPHDGEVSAADLGIPGLTPDGRVHVRMDSNTQTGEESMLFQTSGLEFQRRASTKPGWKLADTQSLGLVLDTTADLVQGVGSMGGERRVVFWQEIGQNVFPACPGPVVDQIVERSACRIVLATPGAFNSGFMPNFAWLKIAGLTCELKGVVTPGFHVVSGWDYEKKRPKETRRLAPAGSVYYLSLRGSTPEAVREFVQKVWFQSISDDDQDRLDGFGIALLGVWDGKPREMEV